MSAVDAQVVAQAITQLGRMMGADQVAAKANLAGGNAFTGDQSGKFLDRGGAVYNSALFASLDALLTEIGAADATILLAPGHTLTLTQNTTIPANVTLSGQMGVIATNGFTLTVNGPVQAGDWPVFDTSGGGSVVLGAHPQAAAAWFVDNALNRAIPAVQGQGERPTLDITADLALPGRRDIGASLVLRARGGKLSKTHGSSGFRIQPVEEVLGDTTGTPTATALQVAGAAWGTNEHVGKWIAVKTTATQHMRCIANTSDTLTLEYALDDVPGTGVEVSAYTPIPYVELDGIELDGTGASGGVGVEVSFVDWLVLRDVHLHHHPANAFTARFCNHVRSYGGRFTDSQFGVFVYHSDDVVFYAPTVERNAAEYGIQLKDCRNSSIIAPICKDNTNVGADIKCSGRYPSFNVSIVGGAVSGGMEGYKAHGLSDEGTTYSAENFQIIAPNAYGCANGVQVLTDASSVMDCTLWGGKITRSTGVGLSLRAPGAKAFGVEVSNGATRGCEVGYTAVVRGCTFRDNQQDGTGEELRLLAIATGCDVRDNTFLHTDAGSGSNRAINELSGASGNIIGPNRIIDSAGGYADDYSLQSGTSPARGHGLDYEGSFTRKAIMEFVGAGDPSGSVAAPVGSLYRRTDGGSGTTLYVKESGTGTSGWAAV